MRSGRERCHRAGAGHSHWLSAALTGAFLAGAGFVAGIQVAAARDETRALTFYHTHTNEMATITFRRDGQYDDQALEQLNWLLRDWRVETPIKMDPRLFDILWEVYRESGSHEPINVISAYRSPATNGMLRERSRAVSEHSQHLAGKAIDVRLPDVDPARLRAIAMKLQYGGVGFYASSNFVHIDTGSVRAWPRMSLEQLTRLFPDGKTVHLPPNGKPLPGYEQARAEIAARDQGADGPVYADASSGGFVSLLGKIFGRSAETGQIPPPTAPAEVSETVAALPATMPLPPRRPAAGPVQVAGRAAPLANLAGLPAPARPEMDWPAPDDDRAVLRALLTAIDGGAAARPAPRIVMVRAQPRPFASADLIGRLEPVASLAGRLSAPTESTERVRFTGSAVSSAPSTEANAGL